MRHERGEQAGEMCVVGDEDETALYESACDRWFLCGGLREQTTKERGSDRTRC